MTERTNPHTPGKVAELVTALKMNLTGEYDVVDSLMRDAADALTAVSADRDRLHKAIESVEDFVTAHYLDTSMGEKVLGILRAALDQEGNDDE